MIEKAQTAMEYYTIVAIALIILLPLSIYVYQLLHQYGDDTKVSLAKDAVNELGETADWVFSQGPPARHTFQSFYIPEGIEETSINNNIILFRIRTSAGISDIYYQTIAPLDGSIPFKSGYYPIAVIAYEDNVTIEVV
jgi:hypothetical protein